MSSFRVTNARVMKRVSASLDNEHLRVLEGIRAWLETGEYNEKWSDAEVIRFTLRYASFLLDEPYTKVT